MRVIINKKKGAYLTVLGFLAGKSCYAKQVALIVFLAHVGSVYPPVSHLNTMSFVSYAHELKFPGKFSRGIFALVQLICASSGGDSRPDRQDLHSHRDH